MKTKTKHLISEIVLLISNLAIAASGINEAIDVKKLVTDFFMYRSLLLQHLRNRLVNASRYIGLRIAKYKVLLVCIVFIPAGTAFMLHCNQATIPILFVMMIMALVLMKNEAEENGFAKGSLR